MSVLTQLDDEISELRAQVRRLEAVEKYAQAAHWHTEANNEELAEHEDTRGKARIRELEAERDLYAEYDYEFLPPNVEHNRRTAASSPGVRVDGPVGG